LNQGLNAPSVTYQTREEWLNAAGRAFIPLFKRAGYDLPAAIRYSFGFPSTGRHSAHIGECWWASASADGHNEIIIRVDLDDPVRVLDVLAHELVHACMPEGEKHGKLFKRCALAIGLTGRMKSTVAGPDLEQQLRVMAAQLGPLRHARLDWSKRVKQSTRMFKGMCNDCGYTIRLTRQWAQRGMPTCVCGTLMRCDQPIIRQQES
jgi:hypothetical protein